MDTDVLIVGAGPTGLMLANQLARRVVKAQIIDRHGGPARETRALGVQARTLEIYAHLGIVDRALELGKNGSGANIWAQGEWKARIPLDDAGRDLTPYPYILVLGQDDNERIMGDRLRELGMSVQWDTELTALEQHPDRVVATLRQPDGSVRTLEAGWVAGCDGARSTVRQACGIPFSGAPYEHVFFVADTEATGSMVPDQVNVYLWRDGFHLFFPMRGKDHWRLVGILPKALLGRQDVGFDAVIPSLGKEAGSALKFKQCFWFSTYRIHHRAAERFRDGRCFVLGDAAHIHSPMGAQGMNTGLQDAYNLAWKLALVVQGRSDAALLDSYAEERIPVAKRLLATTDTAFRAVVSESWIAGVWRTAIVARIIAFAMRRRSIQRIAFRTVSQIGISYRSGALAQSLDGFPSDAPQPGDRFPWLKLRLAQNGAVEDLYRQLDDTRFNLLVIGQPAPAGPLGLADMLSVLPVADDRDNDATLARARIPRLSFFLVRPDGYIALCGGRLEAGAIERYARERLRIGASTLPDGGS